MSIISYTLHSTVSCMYESITYLLIVILLYSLLVILIVILSITSILVYEIDH